MRHVNDGVHGHSGTEQKTSTAEEFGGLFWLTAVGRPLLYFKLKMRWARMSPWQDVYISML